MPGCLAQRLTCCCFFNIFVCFQKRGQSPFMGYISSVFGDLFHLHTGQLLAIPYTRRAAVVFNEELHSAVSFHSFIKRSSPEYLWAQIVHRSLASRNSRHSRWVRAWIMGKKSRIFYYFYRLGCWFVCPSNDIFFPQRTTCAHILSIIIIHLPMFNLSVCCDRLPARPATQSYRDLLRASET